ncbi:MAG TPA: hypothetical protein VJS17_01790 [Pyrinomonadaceae bacterium]|nr:hypothetical protein [Pyrinomonadaceae bacterium]
MDFDRNFPTISARFRATHDFARRNNFMGGFPNFNFAPGPSGTVFGSMLLKDSVAAFSDVPAAELGNPDDQDLGARFRACHAFARRNGFIGAFPNFFEAGVGSGRVYGTTLLREGVAEFRDVTAGELGNPDPADISTRFRVTHDFARRNGFLAGYPNFFQADQPQGRVYGTILIKEEDAAFADLNSKDLFPQVFGAIGDKWLELGGLTSFLGAPTSDELNFEDGKVRFFLGGTVYFWGDTGAMAVPNNTIVVRYSGLNCFGTTDGAGDDEPYFLFGIVAPGFNAAPRTRIFEGVSAGSNVSDSLELYRGAPLGIGIDVTLMEHDADDPDKYRSLVERAVNEAVPRVTQVLTLVPAIGQVLSIGARVALELLHGDIVDALNGLLGTDEDRLGQQLIHLTPKQMIVLATQTPINDLGGVRSKLQSGLFDGEGSSYKACFDIAPA